MKSLFSILLIGIFIASCGSEVDVKDEKTTLKKKRARWESLHPDTYEYTASRNCFCTDEYTSPIRMQIIDNELDTAYYVSLDFSYFSVQDSARIVSELRSKVDDLMIDKLFDQILTRLNSKPYSATIDYNPNYSYPRHYFFDLDENIADEEYGVTVSEFTAN